MQELLFNGEDGNGKTATEHVKGRQKFNVTNIPDAFIFMTFEDYTCWREAANPLLLHANKELMQVPSEKNVQYTLDVEDALKKLVVAQPEVAPDTLDPELNWLIQFHSQEPFEGCGGLSIGNKSLLPLGILTMLKRKVTWQMVLRHVTATATAHSPYLFSASPQFEIGTFDSQMLI